MLQHKRKSKKYCTHTPIFYLRFTYININVTIKKTVKVNGIYQNISLKSVIKSCLYPISSYRFVRYNQCVSKVFRKIQTLWSIKALLFNQYRKDLYMWFSLQKIRSSRNIYIKSNTTILAYFSTV